MSDEPEALVDTHILVWARQDPSKLSSRQRKLLADIQTRESRIAISAITLWELGMMLVRKKLKTRLSLPAFLQEIENSPWIRLLPINAAVAAESILIRPSLNADPADGMIVATARVFHLPLLTADERIIDSKLAIIV